MAIIIPSKNIYEMGNPKVRDNLINNVNVEQVIASNKLNEEAVFSEKIDVSMAEDYEVSDNALKSSQEISGVSDSFQTSVSLSAIGDIVYKKFNFKIPVLQKNKIVKRTGVVDEDNNILIQFTLEGRKATGDVDVSLLGCEWDFDVGDSMALLKKVTSLTIHEPDYSKFKVELDGFNIPSSISSKVTTIVSGYGEYALSTNAEINFESVLKSSQIKLIESEDCYMASVIIPIRGDTLNGYHFTKYEGNFGVQTPEWLDVKMKYTEYLANFAKITVNGITYGLDLTDNTTSYIKDQNGNIIEGSGNKPHSLSGNELLQDSVKVANGLFTKHLAENVLTQYAKGKETATLLCDINDYKFYEVDFLAKSSNSDKQLYPLSKVEITDTFNTDDTLRIKDEMPIPMVVRFKAKSYEGAPILEQTTSIPAKQKKITIVGIIDSVIEIYYYVSMAFNIHDEVIPMVFGADGKDKPMSKYQDGSPKVFEVTGSNIIYDGAVWQELTLLEKKQEIT